MKDIIAYEKQFNVTIDTATPQAWFDAVSKLGIDAREYYWAYDKDGGMAGRPLHKSEISTHAIREDITKIQEIVNAL
tara:strand:- start:132 stop:362 length:231 start_codon:yes stop_codon:yes gene_type:complete